jgi:hypothetical protein
MRIRRDPGSTDEVKRAYVEGTTGANGGPPHIHLFQEERFIVHTGALQVRRGRDRIKVMAGEEIRIPPKVRHTFRAETDSTDTVESRPALRISSSSGICLQLPRITSATRDFAMPPARCAPTRTSSSTSRSSRCHCSGHCRSRSPSSDLLVGNQPRSVFQPYRLTSTTILCRCDEHLVG